jgi:hypothetical protein
MSHGNRSLLAGIVGLAAGTAAAGGTYLLRRRLGARSAGGAHERLETEVVDALCEDEIAGSLAIDVAALGPGLIELSGRVPDQSAGLRAADSNECPVHTVANRPLIEQVEQQLEATRRRYHAANRNAGPAPGKACAPAWRTAAERGNDPVRPDDRRWSRTQSVGTSPWRRAAMMGSECDLAPGLG